MIKKEKPLRICLMSNLFHFIELAANFSIYTLPVPIQCWTSRRKLDLFILCSTLTKTLKIAYQ